MGEALSLAVVDAPECVRGLDRAASPEVQGRADLAVSDPTDSVAGRGVMALPAGGRDLVLAMVGGRVVGPDAAGALVRRAASQASAPVVLALLAWVPAEISVLGAGLAAPALTVRGGVVPADRDRGSRVLMVHAVSAVGRGAMAAVAVLQAVSVAIAALVRTGHEASAVAGQMVLEVPAVAWGADLVAMAVSVPAADSPDRAALASIPMIVTTTGQLLMKTSTAARRWLASTTRRGTVTNGA